MVNSAALSVQNIQLDVGAFKLQGISLQVAAGQCCVLLGPTGSGKSLLVESICGLRRIHGGSVTIGGRDVTRLDPALRNIGYVPQDYALLPFQTVRENLGFGLLARGTAARQRRQQVDKMLSLLRIEHLADRHPRHLSGGERQRVALGRALVGRPDVLLLDEPLSALDEHTAEDLISEMLELRRQFGITTVHICHRLEEALRVADQLALLSDGRLVQAGSPQDLFRRPASMQIARMLRLPNVLRGNIVAGNDGRPWFSLGRRLLAPADGLAEGPANGIAPAEALTLSHRPPADDPSSVSLEATVQNSYCSLLRPELRLCGTDFAFIIPGIFPPDEWPAGSQIFITFPRAALHVLPAAE